ncbi:hypothetical protein Tco_1114687 [Tanacetum coccineum]|uniref:Uncharacterized protein n=1 Tax=Tanacetum coccineum TaxID=301880 RepID=A0ABQ5IZG5_9ASTR
MAEAGFGTYWDGSDRLIPDKGDLRDYYIEILSDIDFLGPAPSYVLIRDPVRRLCHRMIAYSISNRGQTPEKVTSVDLFYLCSMDRGTANIPHLLTQYLFRHAEGRKSGARLLGGHFIGRLAMQFRLVSDEGLRGLQRQHAAMAGAHEAKEAGLAADKGAQEIPAPTPAHGTPPPPPAPQPRTMTQRIKRIEEEIRDLRHDVIGLQGVIESFNTEQTRVSTWLISCMTQFMDASGHTYQAFDSTLISSSRMPYQRRVRPRTSDACTPHPLILMLSLTLNLFHLLLLSFCGSVLIKTGRHVLNSSGHAEALVNTLLAQELILENYHEQNIRKFSCAGDVVDFRTWPDISLETTMISTMDLDGGTCSTGDPHETMILGSPFLATIHALINVFHREISLGLGEDRFLFDMNGYVHHPPNPVKKVCMAKTIQEEESYNLLEIGEDLFSYDSSLCLKFEKYNHLYDIDECDKDTFVCDDYMHEKFEQVCDRPLESWYEDRFEEEEKRKCSMDGAHYDPHKLCVDTYKVRRYSFGDMENFVCVKKKEKKELPISRVNGSRFKGMIRNDMDTTGRVQRKA